MNSNSIFSTTRFALVQAFVWGGYAVILAFASVYLLPKGFTNAQIGYLIAVSCTISAISQPIVGAFADKAKRCILHILITGMAIAIILAAICEITIAHNIWVIALMYGILFCFLQSLTPLSYSLGMFFINKGIPINFGVTRGIGSLSYAIIAYVLGKLVEKYNTDVVMYCTIFVYILLILSTVTFHFKGVGEDNPNANNESAQKAMNTVEFIAKHKRFVAMLIGTTCLYVSHNMLGNYLFQIVSYHGKGSVQLGIISAIAAVFELPVLFSLTWINRKLTSGMCVRIAAVFFTLKSFATFLAPSIEVIYFAQFFQMLGYGLFAGASVIYVSHVIEEENQVQGQSFVTLTCTVGAVIGSLLGGTILDKTAVPGLLLASTIISLCGTLICLFTAENGRKG